MAAACKSAAAWALSFLSRPEDTPMDVQRKLMHFAMMVSVEVGVLICSFDPLLTDYLQYTCYVTLAVGAVLIGVAVVRKHVSLMLMRATLLFLFFFVAATDIGLTPVGMQTWPIFVLQVDFALVCEAPSHWATIIASCACLYIVLIELEMDMRFGLLDIPGLTSYETRRDICNCNQPPCPRNNIRSLPLYLIPKLCVFAMDFGFTRHFAMAAVTERERMKRSIDIAEYMTQCLVLFDLDTARAYLAEGGEALPDELLESFQSLLANLASYRPYLPQACLPGRNEGAVDAHSDDDSAAGSGCGVSTVAGSCDGSEDAGSQRRRSGRHGSGALTLRRETSFGSMQSGVSPVKVHCTDTISPHVARIAQRAQNSLRTVEASLLELVLKPFVDEPNIIDDLNGYVTRHEAFLTGVLAAVGSSNGVVDAFEGNRVICSFNATRSAVMPYSKALTAIRTLSQHIAEKLTEVACTGAIATGAVYTGVMGTSNMRRPCVLGRLTRAVEQMNSVASIKAVKWVCNRKQYNETSLIQEMRILLDRVYIDDGDLIRGAYPVYEVILERNSAAGSPGSKTGPEEWMYEMEKSEARTWDAYNEVGLTLVRGDGVAPADATALFGDKVSDRVKVMFAASVAERVSVVFRPQISGCRGAVFDDDDSFRDCVTPPRGLSNSFRVRRNPRQSNTATFDVSQGANDDSSVSALGVSTPPRSPRASSNNRAPHAARRASSFHASPAAQPLLGVIGLDKSGVTD